MAQAQALLLDMFAEGRHGSGGQPAHIGMVPAACDKEAGRTGAHKHRRDRRDVRQMGPSMEGVIADHHITGLERRHRPLLHLGKQIHHGIPHGAQMHGNVGRIGHKGPFGIEQGAGKIEPFADIHRSAGLAQPFPHPFRDHHEAVMEEAQLHRVHNCLEV